VGIGVTTNLNAVAAASATTVFVAGDTGTIMLTIDNGATWTTQGSGTIETLRAIVFPTGATQVAWAAGDRLTIQLTTNQGTAWTSQSGANVTGAIRSISAATSTVAMAAGDGG